MTKRKSEEGKSIYCDGGAELINELTKNDLINEPDISVIPFLLKMIQGYDFHLHFHLFSKTNHE
ncbi:dihydrofolate reductase family protein [Salegentibacter sp. F63223]|nr:dihydrofolate reductase family protein [Salegentibacter maritimus]